MGKDDFLFNQPKKLFQLSKLIQKGVLSLDELSELIPGILHVNSREDFALHFISQEGRDIMGYSLEEIREMGASIFTKHQSAYTRNIIYPRLQKELAKDDAEQVYSLYQDWQRQKGEKPVIYFTTSRILNEDEIISITLDPGNIQEMTEKVTNLFEQNKIFDTYFTAYQGLTQREREVLQLLGNGHTRQEISNRLFISFNTVKKHIENIYKKLEVANRVDLERIAQTFSYM